MGDISVVVPPNLSRSFPLRPTLAPDVCENRNAKKSAIRPPRTTKTCTDSAATARCKITASKSSMRRATSGNPRKTSATFSSRRCSAAARSKSNATLADSRSVSSSPESDSPAVERKFTPRELFRARVFFGGASCKTWGQTHFHFGIDASGKSWIAPDFDLASPNFE